MRKRLDEAQQSLRSAEKQRKQLFASMQAMKEEQTTLQSTIQALAAVETKYKEYKDREPEIKHYLGQFSGVAR